MQTQAITQHKPGDLPWPLIGLLGLAFTLLVFVIQLPFFFSPGLLKATSNLLEHVYVLVILLALTAFTRTLPLRTLAVFWFIGLYPALALAVLAGLPLAHALGEHNQFLDSVWVPFSEELIKALPVALYLGLMARRQGWRMAASDGLLLGFVVGAGFAFHEDAMARRVSGGGWLASTWSIFLPTLAASGSPYQTRQIILGHAGWTALVGLALGLAFLYRRYRAAWLLPLFGLGLVMLDHGLSNYYSNLGRDTAPALISLLRGGLLRGRLTIIFLLVGSVAAIVVEQRILRWAARRDRFFPAIPLSTLLTELRLPLSWPRLLHLQAMREYLRRRRAAYYALWVWRGTSSDTKQADDVAATLFTLGIEAGLPLGPHTPPAPVSQPMSPA